MTTMEATLGLTENHSFGYGPEPLPYALGKKQQLKLWLQTQSFWFSHSHVCNVHHKRPSDDPYRLCRQIRAFSLTLSASLITSPTSPAESTFKLVTENAYNSPSMEPHIVSILDSTPSRSHPNTRKHFPSNGASVYDRDSHALSEENTLSASVSDEDIIDTLEAVAASLKCLEVTGLILCKCLKNAAGVSEDDVVLLLKTLSFYGFSCSDIKSMFAKYPPLVKVKGPQVQHCFQYYFGLGFGKSVVKGLFFKRPALLACDSDRTSEVVEYLLSIGIKKAELSSIIASRPHIFEHGVAVLKSIVSALMKANLDQSQINRLIKRSPNVFAPSQEDIERSLTFWSHVGVEGKALYRAILRRPNLLSYNTAHMLGTYNYLQLWFDQCDLTKLVSRFAELLSYDPQAKLKPVINYFLELGLSEREVAKVILRRPQVMAYKVDRLKRVAAFLTSLGMQEDMVGRVLITSPQVFTLNTEDKLKRGIEFFRSMGLKTEKDLEYLFARSAQLFCCSIERNLQPTITFFLDRGLEEDLSAMIVAFPSMLGQNVENSLAPKYEYLVGEMKRTHKELVDFPQYFGYSLERRIKPRHKLLSERGLSKSLPSMLACKDSDFFKRYVEPYSPLPQHIAASHEGATGEFVVSKKQKSKKQKVRRKKAVVPLTGVTAKPIQQDLPSVASPQETSLIIEDASSTEDQTQLQESEPYPASFRKIYKNLNPCGMWLHAYKFDTE